MRWSNDKFVFAGFARASVMSQAHQQTMKPCPKIVGAKTIRKWKQKMNKLLSWFGTTKKGVEGLVIATETTTTKNSTEIEIKIEANSGGAIANSHTRKHVSWKNEWARTHVMNTIHMLYSTSILEKDGWGISARYLIHNILQQNNNHKINERNESEVRKKRKERREERKKIKLKLLLRPFVFLLRANCLHTAHYELSNGIRVHGQVTWCCVVVMVMVVAVVAIARRRRRSGEKQHAEWFNKIENGNARATFTFSYMWRLTHTQSHMLTCIHITHVLPICLFLLSMHRLSSLRLYYIKPPLFHVCVCHCVGFTHIVRLCCVR